MTRIVKTAADRKGEILDAAQRLFGELGYANTSVQIIIDSVGIAKGTFYHHFQSKSELLDALVIRLVEQIPPLIRPLIDNPDEAAIDKFLGFFQRINSWKVSHRALMLELGNALSDDANLRLFERLRGASFLALTPMLAEIIAQGIREKVFEVPFPVQTAHIILTILGSLSSAFLEVLNGPAHDRTSRSEFEAVNIAHAQAIERVLGAQPGAINIFDPETVGRWLDAALARGSDDPATNQVKKHRRTS